MSPAPPRGRAASGNPASRFHRIEIELDGPGPEKVATEYLSDDTRTIIARNDSPDVPFDASINPYRGCEHGCVYCYARPTHEYLGFSAGLDFETRILVKEEAPALLERELARPSWRPRVLGLSGVTDPYQPIERKLGLTRGCLEVLAACRNPVSVVTKNHLVTRDADLLGRLARHRAASVLLSVTTLDAELARRMEPRTSHPRKRLEAVAELNRAGVPAGVLIAPVLPGLTDHEIPALVEAAAEAGAVAVGCMVLRLPGAVAGLLESWLETYYPDRRGKVLSRIRSLRGGRLNDSRYGVRFRGEGPFAEQIRSLWTSSCRRHGMPRRTPELSAAAFRRPGGQQLGLFE